MQNLESRVPGMTPDPEQRQTAFCRPVPLHAVSSQTPGGYPRQGPLLTGGSGPGAAGPRGASTQVLAEQGVRGPREAPAAAGDAA